jgi:hypothetical protein
VGAGKTMTEDQGEDSKARSAGRPRRILAGIALVLACLAILISTVAVWTHQVVLDTDRFTALVAEVLDDPVVIDPLADRISTEVVSALDVEGRIAAQLPGPTQALAGPITLAIRDGIDNRLQIALARPGVQAGLTRVVSFTHARIINLLRAEPDSVTVEDGYIVVAVFPVVGAALEELQAIGLIPADVQLPDLSSGEPPDILSGRLATALGVTLPPDFGTIKLMKADRLLAARSAVQAFDIIVIAMLVLTVVLIVLAVWLSTSRLRMVILLGLGSIIAFALARLAINGLESLLLSGIADADLAGAIRAMVDTTLADLRGVVTLVLVAIVILVVVAFILSRRSGAAGPGLDRSSMERIGLVGIAFVVLWVAIGLDVALLALALIVALSLIVGALAPGTDADEATTG